MPSSTAAVARPRGRARSPKRALAQRDRGVELVVERRAAASQARERRARRRRRGREVDEPLRDVDADDLDARVGAKCVGVTTRAAADVEHRPGASPSDVDQEGDLLLGALRERVAQVRRPR